MLLQSLWGTVRAAVILARAYADQLADLMAARLDQLAADMNRANGREDDAGKETD